MNIGNKAVDRNCAIYYYTCIEQTNRQTKCRSLALIGLKER